MGKVLYKRIINTTFILLSLLLLVGCGRLNDGNLQEGTQSDMATPIQEVNVLTDKEAKVILAELMQKANHANIMSTGMWRYAKIDAEKSGQTLPNIQSVADMEAYFHSVFAKETAEKYLYPLTTGITVNGRTLPLYGDGEEGLVTENRALADPLLLGTWMLDSVEILSVTEKDIFATATYNFAYDKETPNTGEIHAIYDTDSDSWRLDDSYGITFLGQTEISMNELAISSPIVEDLFDRVEMAEIFLTKEFQKDTELQYMDFISIEESNAESQTVLNTELLAEIKSELEGILRADDPVKALGDHFAACFTPDFAKKWAVAEQYTYEATSGKIYMSAITTMPFMSNIRDRACVVSEMENQIVLLSYDYDMSFEEDEQYYRYVWLVKQDGTWKITESVMLNSLLHMPDMYNN